MRHSALLGAFVATVCLMATACLVAQGWQNASTLPGVDLSRLTLPRKQTALKLMRTQGCPCGCDMKIAECRIKDPSCSVSRGLSGLIVDQFKAGKSEADTLAAVKDSPLSKIDPGKVLEDAVSIPTAGAPVAGPADARVTLVEFSDFQCPYCAQARKKLNEVLKAYPNQVKLIFKQFPLDNHSQAAVAAAAAIAAHHQGKFWPLHDAMFDNRERLSRATILAMAKDAGLDMPRFTADMDSAATRKAVERDRDEGDKIGVNGTPAIYIDGQKYNGSLALDAMRPFIEAELKKAAKK